MLIVPMIHTFRIYSRLMYLVLSLRKGRSHSKFQPFPFSDLDISNALSAISLVLDHFDFGNRICHILYSLRMISFRAEEVRIIVPVLYSVRIVDVNVE
jgi:hypothetical protein